MNRFTSRGSADNVAAGPQDRTLHQFGDAVADHRLDVLKAYGRQILFAEQRIRGIAQILGAVDQRAVEIEDDGFEWGHGAVSKIA